MLYLHTNYSSKKCKLMARNNELKIIRRTMLKQAINHSTQVIRPMTFQGFSRQPYPGNYKAVRYEKNVYPVRGGTGKAIPKHETYHVNLQETKTGEIFGGFTSHPKPNDPHYHKISDQKLDGTLGEQYLGLYHNPKIITGDSKLVRELPEHQPFIDQHENHFHTLRAEKKHAIREDRTSKQDSRFYNENGTRDEDNFPTK